MPAANDKDHNTTPATPTETVVAQYLAAGGAYVTVTRNVEIQRFATTCEACGYVNGSGYLDTSEDDTRHAQDYTERHADTHAGTCRRLPERLWPIGGAR